MTWPKPIVFSVRFGVNYLWHVLAVAKVGYDSDYAGRFVDTISRDDLGTLESHRELLVFGEGEGGALSGFFTALPAWLKLDDANEFEEYFGVLDATLEQGSLEPVVAAYPGANWSDRFFREFLRQEFPANLCGLRGTASELSAVYLRNIGKYRERVWPEAEPLLRKRAAELDDIFSKEDYISKWEVMLGLPFAADQYDITLCYANRNGPDYNSLGYDGNLFYFDKPIEKTCQFVSHEIGTHLLIDLYFKLAVSGEFEHRRLYAAYETLAMFYNRLILGVAQLEYSLEQMNDSHYLSIYSESNREGIAPESLIRAALN